MKTLGKLFVFGFALAGFASAATYAVSNGSGASANGITNSAGVAFVGNGVVGIGTFAEGTNFGLFTSGEQLVDAFDLFGTTGAFTTAGIFGNAGIFSLSTAGLAANAPFANSDIYLMVGNGATYQSSTEFLVLLFGRDFLPADDNSGTPIDIIFSASSQIMIGQAAVDVRTTTADSTVTPGFRTVAVIPEPSVALLSVLGFLGLMRRRR